ncbi:MAG: hypothetical protein ACE147_02310 [Candidatus Methylomirabilales bacterium]
MGSPRTVLLVLRGHGPLAAEEVSRRGWPGQAQDALVGASLLAHLIDRGYVVCLGAGPEGAFARAARGRDAAAELPAGESLPVLLAALLLLPTLFRPVGDACRSLA